MGYMGLGCRGGMQGLGCTGWGTGGEGGGRPPLSPEKNKNTR